MDFGEYDYHAPFYIISLVIHDQINDINSDLKKLEEAHKASAAETRATIETIMTRIGGLEDRALMGLSATPGRTTVDSFDNELLASMFGNKIIGIDTQLMNAVNLSPQEAANAIVEKDVRLIHHYGARVFPYVP